METLAISELLFRSSTSIASLKFLAHCYQSKGSVSWLNEFSPNDLQIMGVGHETCDSLTHINEKKAE